MVYVINYSWTSTPAKNAGRQLYFCCSWPYSQIIEKQKDTYYFFSLIIYKKWLSTVTIIFV